MDFFPAPFGSFAGTGQIGLKSGPVDHDPAPMTHGHKSGPMGPNGPYIGRTRKDDQ